MQILVLLMFAACRKKKKKQSKNHVAKITDTDAGDESNSHSC